MLRELKKERTRRALSAVAIEMFLADGFDQVSVADIAAAAEVSKPTLFRYFATKEDLVLHRFADHIGEPARTVRERDPARSPLSALHHHFQAGLDRRDPVTGLCDRPDVLAFHRLVFTTPSLASRLADLETHDVDQLTSALDGTLMARLVATQIVAVLKTLARENWRGLADGRTADSLYPEATVAAAEAFSLLSDGAGSRGY
ncbi:TetR/AcrR family transcriptional regulator [Actinocrispum wychmicini]|uniref:TetR family transcriptional regulator n=1 Tax=Actinocrispum wychmicini TaxID=1213861 RepID=A0A4R2JNE3_9PSEU|nr:TetR/AcrR family transcriptional regulator [Actinocrispum wychmicini]TCO60844.1 TetR family transcriptional regulator [Actinocrispum wychmicini]